MLFTASKSLGIAGSRFGWALVRDAEVASDMANYVGNTCMHISNDVIFRATNMMKYVAKNPTFFDPLK